MTRFPSLPSLPLGKGRNGSDFHPVRWSTTTLTNIKGDIGIRNLKHVQIALITKNILVVLNVEDKHCVHIFNSEI